MAYADALTGRTVGHYAVGERLGQGGMGIVYRAMDTRLNRPVALKVLPPDLVSHEERRRRFVHEAQTASALNHPNIVTIHDIDSTDGDSFIVMELVDGETLSQRIGSRGLPPGEAVALAIQIADALAAAHTQGIVHRDLKPGNIMVTRGGVAKVLDFGLAKLTDADTDAALTRTALTQVGAMLGTVAYMSPEQTEGKPVDTRSDIFAFGAVLYEMLTGRRAFPGDTVAVLSAMQRAEPQLSAIDAPDAADLDAIVVGCLWKDAAQRFQRIDEVKARLEAWKARMASGGERVASGDARRTFLRTAAAIVVLPILGASGWFWRDSRNTAWAYGQMPEIRRLAAAYDYTGALALAEEARRYIPQEAELAQLLQDSSWQTTIASDPPGASVAMRPYGAEDRAWRDLGVTPIQNVRIPRGQLEWRASLTGHHDAHVFTNAVSSQPARIGIRLAPLAQVSEGMVPIPGAVNFNLTLMSLAHLQAARVPDFQLGQYEVTNAQFKAFVDKGGYRNPAYWKHPFIKDGATLTFKEAMAQFTDATGQPGPSTWKLGTFPEGAAEAAVGGVSWFEAAAYAEFAGKSLPLVAEWNLAARPPLSPQAVVLRSNFESTGPLTAGPHTGMNPFGTYDMAGNVREWCWNEETQGSGRRYILGGAWDDPGYRFIEAEIRSAFNRSATNGFRLAHRLEASPEENTAPLKPVLLDYVKRKPASDAEFQIYASLHAYDRSSKLNAIVERTWDELYWTKERITFDAAYNGERMVAFLFLPKNASPPYQTLIYWPGTIAQTAPTSDSLEMTIISFLMQRGRAVLYPIYKGTYERGGGEVSLPGSMAHRDQRLEQFKDFGRSLDYLETRSDIDTSKIGFYGLSWGANMGAYVPALEKRLKVSVLVHGGYRMNPYPPEVDPFNYAPHVTIPTLMLSGEYDSTFPPDVSQVPMFRQLGTPDSDKQRIVFKIGHEFLPTEFAKETLAWFDRYLGEVNHK